MKRGRRQIFQATGHSALNGKDVDRKEETSMRHHGVQQEVLGKQQAYDSFNKELLGRMKVGKSRSGVAMAKFAFMYSIVAIIYSLSFLSSISFLQVEVATAFAFKLPKPPRIVSNLIKSGRSSRENEQIAPIIQDWSLDKKLSDDGAIRYSLVGTVTGHPAIPDGDAIFTAPLETRYVDIANKLMLNTEKNPKFILKGQSSKYTKLVATVSGTKYSLLPPNIKIGDAPLLSRGRGTSEANSNGQIANSLSYKDKLSYLEEQIEVVRLLAEREDQIEREKLERERSAEIVRDAGIVAAAALAGAAYFVGDTANLSPVTTDPTASVNRVQDSVTKVEASSQISRENGGEEDILPAPEIQFAQPAKTILPYLEERIRALEEEQQKLKERQGGSEMNGNTQRQENKPQSNSESKGDKTNIEDRAAARESTSQAIDTAELEIKSDSTPKAPVQGGMVKILTDIKESIKEPDSGLENVVSGVVNADTKEDTTKLERTQSSQQQPNPSSDVEESKRASSLQGGITKLFTDVKESIKQPESESDSITTGTDVSTNEEQIQSSQQQTGPSPDAEESKRPSSLQGGMVKILTDVKESIKQPESESDSAATDTDVSTNEEQIQSSQQQMGPSPDAEESKRPSSLQGGMVKILTDVKESIKQPESESDSATTDTDVSTNEEQIQSSQQQTGPSPDAEESKRPSSLQGGITKLLTDVKESIKQQDSELTPTEVVGADATGEQIQSSLQQTEPSRGDEETKQASSSQKAPSVQEGMAKLLNDVKESIQQPEFEPGNEVADVVNAADTVGEEIQQQSGLDDESAKSTSTSKVSSVQEGMAKLLNDVKESILQPDSEPDNEEVDFVDPEKDGKDIQQESGSDDEDAQSTSTSKVASVQEGMAKILTDIKESIKLESVATDDMGGVDTIGEEIQPESSSVEEEAKASTSTPKESSVQEEMVKILTDIKESIKPSDSESESVAVDVIADDTNKGIANAEETDPDFADAEMQPQAPQSQKVKVVEKIGKIAEELSLIQQDASKEIGTVVSDLSWAGKQVLGDAIVSSDDTAVGGEKNIEVLAYSALSIFGEDGINLLYQYAMDALNTVSDAFSLDRLWTELMELSSKMKLPEDPRISELLKELNYDEEESIRLVAAASFVAIVGVTVALVVRSRTIPDEGEQSGGTSLYEDSLVKNEFDPGVNGWDDATDIGILSYGAEMAYEDNGDENAASPFPFATSNWDDQSNTYVNDEYSMYMNNYDAKSSYFTSYDESTSPFENISSEMNNNQGGTPNGSNGSITSKSSFSSSDKTQQENINETKAAKMGSSPFGTSSSLPNTGRQDNKQNGNIPKESSSPFSNPSSLPKTTQSERAPKAGFSPFGVSTPLPKNGKQKDSTKTPKSSFSSKGLQQRENKDDTPQTSFSAFGDSSTGRKTNPKASAVPFPSSKAPQNSSEKGDDTNSPKANFSPFGRSSTLPNQKNGLATTPKADFSPFDGPSTLPSNGEKEGDEVNTSKAGVSPFGLSSTMPNNRQESGDEKIIPKENSSPFGAPKKLQTRQQESGDQATPKTSFSPFGAPPKVPTSTPKVSSSLLGAPPTPQTEQQESSDQTSTPKASFSPFGAPPKVPKSTFGAPPKPQTKQQERGNQASTPKASFSPFGAPPKVPTSTFGAPPKPQTKQQESGDQTSTPKASFSPLDVPSKKQQTSTPKASFSPFGAPPKVPTNTPNTGSSSFGAPPKLQTEQQESGDQTSTPKTKFSPFGATPKQQTSTLKASSSPFGAPPKQQASSPKTNSSPFGATPKQQTRTPKTSFSPAGISSPTPKSQQASDVPPISPQTEEKVEVGEITDSEPEATDFRIKPKMASKPQNDMYERMQKEQAMRLAEFERKQMSGNKSRPQADEGRFTKGAEENNLNSAPVRLEEERRVAAEKAEIEKERRTIAQERARLDREKREREEQSQKGKKTENEKSRFDGSKRGNKETMELNEEDQKEKERMKEIQKLAREQARFEIEARGLPKEEKTLQEKVRMERLHQLAREQARFEYDRRLSNEKRNAPAGRIGSTTTVSNTEDGQNRRSKFASSSKPKEEKTGDQGRKTLFQTGDTPSVEENMQNRVRQEFSNEPTGKQVTRQTSSKAKEKSSQVKVVDVRKTSRQVRIPPKDEDTLMGTKKKNQDQEGVFDTSRSGVKEETTRGEKARLEQLENLSKKQAQYKKDRTVSTSASKSSDKMNKKRFFSKESEGQIIDVEAAEDDGNEPYKRESRIDGKDDRPDELQSISEQQNRQEKSDFLDREKEAYTKDQKRKQLEVQARQRSKQQYRRNDKSHMEQTRNSNKNTIAPDPTSRPAVASERTESEKRLSLASKTYRDEQTWETKQQKEIADAILKSDGSYQPSAGALADTSRMLKEVRGFSLSDYKGSKEFIHKKSNVNVYVGRTLSIPVRVSTPGSFIEFSITKKASDFDMTILAVPDKGYAFDIKKTAPFTQYGGRSGNVLRDTVLIGAASTPCTLQFKFENKGSTLLDKVIVSYDIKVTSPSRELLLDARRRRTECCLQAIEEEMRGIPSGSKRSALEEEIIKLMADMKEKTKEIASLTDEEQRWNALIDKMKSKAP